MRASTEAPGPRRPCPSLVALCLAMVLLLVAAGCGEEAPESLVSKIPPEIDAVLIDGEVKASGAWLRNMAATQELILRANMQGVPIEVNEHSLLTSSLSVLTRINILAHAGEKAGLSVTEQEINDKLSQEVERFESTEQWQAVLEAAGLSVEERRDQVRLELLFSKYRDEVLLPRAMDEHATEENLRRFYEEHPELWEVPLRLHLFHIHRTVARDAPESERARERARIEGALERIEAGEKFEDVAREVSTETSALRGGDMGWVNERQADQIPPTLREATFSLEAGEVSDIVESPAGYHIFRAEEREDARTRPFEEVKDEIRARFEPEAIKLEINRELARLRDQFDVRVIDLEQLIGPPPAREPAPPSAPTGAGEAPAPTS